MTPEQEAKFDQMHEAVIRMDTRIGIHLENHLTQPCEDMKTMQRDIRGALCAAVVALIATVWQLFGLSK